MLHCSGLWLVTPMKFSWILHTVLGTFPIFFYPVLKCPFLVPTVIPTPNYFLATLCPGVRGPKGLLQLPSLQHGVSLMSLQCDTKNWAVTRAPTASQNQWSCGNVCPVKTPMFVGESKPDLLFCNQSGQMLIPAWILHSHAIYLENVPSLALR